MSEFTADITTEEQEKQKQKDLISKSSDVGSDSENSGPVMDDDKQHITEKKETEEEKAFKAVWGDINPESLHKRALSYDLKEEVAQNDGEKEIGEEKKNELNSKLSKMSLFNSGRTEKTRRNHLSDAAKGFELASVSLKNLKEEKKLIEAEKVNATTSEEKKALSKRIMDNTAQAEKTIDLLFAAKIHRFKGVRNSGENDRKLAELKIERLKMLLNLYREELKNPILSTKDKTILANKALRLQVYKDATANKLALMGQNLAETYEKYQDMEGSDAFLMSEENVYNKDGEKIKRVYTKFAGVEKDPGRLYGYIGNSNAMYMNKMFRLNEKKEKANKLKETDPKKADQILKGVEAEEKELEKTVTNHMMFKDPGDDVATMTQEEQASYWKNEVEKTTKAMDEATGINTLPRNTKLYRMIGSGILNWGFGLGNGAMDGMPHDLLTQRINKHAGMELKETGYMSTGWAVDREFSDRPIMLTMLADEGQKCFVTKNFAEGEIIFGRNTRYVLLGAINHERDPKKLPATDSEIEDNVKNGRYVGTGGNVYFSGIELVVKIVNENDTVKGENK